MQRLLTITAISGFSPFMELLRKCVSHAVTASPSRRGPVVVLGLSWSRAPHLYGCRITDKGCAALVSALKSNPSHLRELDLSLNNPGESGVKLLSDLLEDPHCKLEKLQLWRCNLTERSCAVLSPALSSNSSSLRELNLGYNKLQDRGVKLLSAGLKSPHCKLEKLGRARVEVLVTRSLRRPSLLQPLSPEASGSAPRDPAVNVEIAPPEVLRVLPASAAGELAETLGCVEHADAVAVEESAVVGPAAEASAAP
ncbi:hypothetical protein NFI96_009367 [Prochilodus magdalenae]|nr:hypothetical protein NFI96_009367 [Prochilodus magdalenae]